MQKSGYTVTSTTVTSTVIPIPQHLEIGKIIGREGRNLKPICEKTGTFISVNTNTKPAQIEIKYNIRLPPPSNNQINEAKNLLNNLVEKIDKERKKHLKEKRENNVRFLDDFNRNNGSNNHTVSRYHKEISVKKERKQSKRETMSNIKDFMKR
ncbi:hypothetical protein C1645_789858 [Glomus cerebriforme]|uniref:K Homology domain-containing protein n=1 Tax=Glomus cerebriforme TaxID=658196 RepID=A0A397SCF5_9GLOM|nr:hypothetical protein C1645_789858 [Glomus cerebriforme]